jgi:glycosyltransferase involved in cell wall biosynthesis
MKRRFGVVVGFDYYARYLSNLMNARSRNWRLQAYPSTRLGTAHALWALRKADALISFGGPGPTIALAEAAQARHIPVVVIWAGTDVLNAAEMPFELAVVRQRDFSHISDGAWLVDELSVLGIHAKYLPVTAVDAVENIAPFPSRFRVLTHLPEPRRKFYGEDRYYAVAREMPEVEFVVVGPGDPNPAAPPNVTFRGYVKDLAPEIDEATVVLRLPEHDGKSMLVLEALARGRRVVWNHDFPHVRSVGNIAEAVAAVKEMYRSYLAGRLAPNEGGRDYVSAEFAPAKIAARFESHLDGVLASEAAKKKGRRRRVAISGLGLFSAEVALQVKRLHPEWETTILCTSSRLEVLTALIHLLRAEVWYSIGSPITDRWVHLCARILRKRRVIHWVGSDIEQFKQSPTLQRLLRSSEIKHLTEVTWTREELQELGMDSDIVALPLRHGKAGVLPLPERFTMMLYLPKSRPEFYGKRDYEALLQEFAGEPMRIIIVGGADLKVPEGMEVENLGWRNDLRDVYDRSTVLVRLTPGDGLSMMVLEALSYGRHVMWSKPFPYATHIRTRENLVGGLRDLLERHKAGTLYAQYVAAEMIERLYSTEGTVGKIVTAWEEVS